MFSRAALARMRVVIHRGLVVLLLGAWPVLGQVMPGEPAPAPPPGRVLDQARVFARDPERLAVLSGRLEELSRWTGFDVRVAVFDSLIGSSVSEQAALLREAWVGEGPGMVLAIERDSGRYDLGWSEQRVVDNGAGEFLPLAGDNDLSAGARLRVEQGLAGLGPLEKGRPESVDRLVGGLADALERAFREAAMPADPAPKFKLFVLGTGLLAAMLLAGMVVAALLRRGDRRLEGRLMFPKVTVGMRLGAPCGGGKISSRAFGALPQRKP